jgi:hypothetical protein
VHVPAADPPGTQRMYVLNPLTNLTFGLIRYAYPYGKCSRHTLRSYAYLPLAG